ncbi:efflux RND transporter periplasmic adaptor subunit [Maribellus maritimus]|uniref:efflux RND transporter periplasmic adaptor subunit n=1 Tax=Maribellus maritimus TaxID=2870838 RepID=UPI001EEBFE90|nr:HlyD family efflux transporter periplasmic adaptor subunit [Maribellus maritimus]MCG6187901.1 HlyD family efflux transporter periplasmic adaptor subunit [Maribellus maritimus]
MPFDLGMAKIIIQMDRDLPADVKKKRKKTILIRIVIGGLILIISVFSLRQLIRPTIRSHNFFVATVETGDVLATVSASGTVLPEFEEIKTSPISSAIVEIHQNLGNEVDTGDTILILDINSSVAALKKLKDELALKKNNATRLKLQLEKTIIDLNTQFNIKELGVESMETDLKEERYLNSIGGGTKEKIEKAELNLKIAKLELEQINQTIENSEKSMQADLVGLNYEISIQQNNINELENKIAGATIKADKKGVVTWINNQIGQTVSEGEEMVKVANLKSYEVQGSISDMHSEKLSNGANVIVRINKQTDIDGQVISISPAIEENLIQFKIKLQQKEHPLLRPNMKVDVFLVTAFKKNVLRVKNGAFYQGGTRQKVFVVENGKLIQKEVEFGESNIDYVEIIKDLSKGEKIVTSDMEDYEKSEQLFIKD